MVVAVLVSACTGGADTAAPAPTPIPQAPDPLRKIAREEGAVRVIVELAVPQKPDGTWDESRIALAQRRVLRALGPDAVVTARYETMPQLALELTPSELTKLRASPLVLGVHLDESDAAKE